jgi:hypothetical protein
MNILDAFEKTQMKEELPEIRIGDKVRISMKIVEGTRQRPSCLKAWSSPSQGKQPDFHHRAQAVLFRESKGYSPSCTQCRKDRDIRAFQGKAREALLHERAQRQGCKAQGDPQLACPLKRISLHRACGPCAVLMKPAGALWQDLSLQRL